MIQVIKTSLNMTQVPQRLFIKGTRQLPKKIVPKKINFQKQIVLNTLPQKKMF